MKKNTYVAPAITETEIRGTENIMQSISASPSSISKGGASGAAAKGSAAWYDEWDEED